MGFWGGHGTASRQEPWLSLPVGLLQGLWRHWGRAALADCGDRQANCVQQTGPYSWTPRKTRGLGVTSPSLPSPSAPMVPPTQVSGAAHQGSVGPAAVGVT